MNKYEMLYDDKIEMGGHTLYRIRALKDFGNVKTGDLGGYIERKENLSQKGNCWVYDNARVFNEAYVYGDARVFGEAYVYGDARVFDNACVCGNARVFGEAYVFDNAHVFGEARICGNAYVYGDARVFDEAYVCNTACVCGNARVCGNAKINKISDVLCISPIGSRNDATTFFKTKDGGICVKCGCFSGTIDRFLEAVSETHKDNKHAKAYRLACELAKVQIELED